ncbi:hypothetical protein VTO42DRAFT_4800 [Malbranchea cinnamomea]
MANRPATWPGFLRSLPQPWLRTDKGRTRMPWEPCRTAPSLPCPNLSKQQRQEVLAAHLDGPAAQKRQYEVLRKIVQDKDEPTCQYIFDQEPHGRHALGDDDVEKSKALCRELVLSMYHTSGTCDDAAGERQVTVFAVAEKAADLIKEDRLELTGSTNRKRKRSGSPARPCID